MMEIVRLESHNAQYLHNMAEDVFDHPIDPRWLDLFVNCPRHQMFLAIDAGRVIGMASGVVYFHPDKPPQLWINEVGVAESHRRRGIGRQLVTKLLERGRELGCAAAWVGTETDNFAAQKLYASVALTGSLFQHGSAPLRLSQKTNDKNVAPPNGQPLFELGSKPPTPFLMYEWDWH